MILKGVAYEKNKDYFHFSFKHPRFFFTLQFSKKAFKDINVEALNVIYLHMLLT